MARRKSGEAKEKPSSPKAGKAKRVQQSPYPGMDPFIETCGLWEDFHTHLIEKIYERLSDTVPDRYLVRTGERSYVVLEKTEGKSTYAFLPDVGITSVTRQEFASGKESGVAVAEPAAEAGPITMRPFMDEEYRETFVEIYEADSAHRLVTCIEVLSPTNKRPHSPGWDLYIRKRQSLLWGRVNLIEIDLLRGGQRMPMLDPWPNSPFTLLVSPSSLTSHCLVWPAYFHRPLPTIPVPLAKPDSDIPLNLQPMIESIYQRSRYHVSIDYAKPLVPPLSSEEVAWLRRKLGMA